MTIQVGERMPEGALGYMGPNGPDTITTAELFGGTCWLLFKSASKIRSVSI